MPKTTGGCAPRNPLLGYCTALKNNHKTNFSNFCVPIFATESNLTVYFFSGDVIVLSIPIVGE